MKIQNETIRWGRSVIEVTVRGKEFHERTPEEHRMVAECVRRILGEPTPEMFEKPKGRPPKAKANENGAKKGGKK